MEAFLKFFFKNIFHTIDRISQQTRTFIDQCAFISNLSLTFRSHTVSLSEFTHRLTALLTAALYHHTVGSMRKWTMVNFYPVCLQLHLFLQPNESKHVIWRILGLLYQQQIIVPCFVCAHTRTRRVQPDREREAARFLSWIEWGAKLGSVDKL